MSTQYPEMTYQRAMTLAAIDEENARKELQRINDLIQQRHGAQLSDDPDYERRADPNEVRADAAQEWAQVRAAQDRLNRLEGVPPGGPDALRPREPEPELDLEYDDDDDPEC